MTPIHQFSRIGCHAMVGGMSRVTHDVPPYTVGGGVPYKLGGINLIGLKRRNFSMETRTALSRCFRLLYRAGLKQEEALDRIAAELPDLEEVRTWLDFCRNSSRGLIGIHGVGAGDRERVNREKLKELIPAN
jgi:UDP-N-acetylglucosamine acyltransferase